MQLINKKDPRNTFSGLRTPDISGGLILYFMKLTWRLFEAKGIWLSWLKIREYEKAMKELYHTFSKYCMSIKTKAMWNFDWLADEGSTSPLLNMAQMEIHQMDDIVTLLLENIFINRETQAQLCYSFNFADWDYLKSFQQKDVLESRWESPSQILTTATTI